MAKKKKKSISEVARERLRRSRSAQLRAKTREAQSFRGLLDPRSTAWEDATFAGATGGMADRRLQGTRTEALARGAKSKHEMKKKKKKKR
jgi:hypothetical protein